MTRRGRVDTLAAAWEAFAQDLGNGYELGLDDYLNDLDGRRLLAEALAAGDGQPNELAERVEAADARVRAATKPQTTCLWGAKNAARERLDAEKHWWYFAVPKRFGEEFRRDLARVK
jgi:hypothetical protein